MEGLYRNGSDAELTKAGSQLTGCSVGIGQGKHAIGGKVTLCNAIGDSVRNRAGLTRAGSCKDAGRADQ